MRCHRPLFGFAMIAFIALPMLAAGKGAAAENVPVKPLRDSARKILADPEFRHFEHFADDAFHKTESAPNGGSTDTASNPGEDSPAPGEAGTPAEARSWWQRWFEDSQPKKSAPDNSRSENQQSSSKPGPSSGEKSSNPSVDGKSGGERSTTDGSTTNGTRGERSGNRPDAATGTTADSSEKTGDPVNESTSARPGQTSDPSRGNSSEKSPPSSRKETGRAERPSSRSTMENTPAGDRPVRMQRPHAPSQRGSDGVERPVRQSSRNAPTPKSRSSSDSRWEGPSLGLGNLLGGLFHGLAYLILAVIAVAIVVLVVQALMQAWSDRPSNLRGMSHAVVGPLTHDRSPGETESDVFLREALALAQARDFRAAIGRLVMGGMSYIERQQWIRYRRGLTVHDYLRVLRSRPEQFAGFRNVVHVFEPVEYGRRPATEPLFAEALAGYRQGFQAPSADVEPVL